MGVVERLERLAGALEATECVAYISAAPVDIRYFTGSEEPGGLLLYAPTHGAALVTRQSAADHARDTVTGGVQVHAHGLDEDATALLAEIAHGWALRGGAACGYLDTPALDALTAGLPFLRPQAQPHLGPRLRRIKEPQEMAAIRQAASIADAATAAAMAAIRVGATELEAAAALESVARMLGCEGNILQTQVKGGTRSAYPDALASPRRFQYGDIGYTDLAIFYKGYLGDLSRAFYIGEIADDLRSLLSVVDTVQTLAKGLLRPGVSGRELYLAVRDAFAEAGYPGFPPHHLGHGIGLAGELPRLALDSEDVLQAGDVFTVEPGVYLPGLGGVRIEDVIVLHETGHEVLSRHPRVTAITT